MLIPTILKGVVVSGDGYGRKLGYPTANLSSVTPSLTELSLDPGVYAGTVTVCANNQVYKSGIVIGPLDAAGTPKVEAHLIDFSGDLYGQTLVYSVQQYLRPFRTYNDESALRADIASDIETIKTMNVCLPE